MHGDNSRASASGLSYVQVGKYGLTIRSTYISVDLAHNEIFCAKVGKGGINGKTPIQTCDFLRDITS